MLLVVAATLLLIGGRAGAQIALPQLPIPLPLGDVTSELNGVADPLLQTTQSVVGARLTAARNLVRNNPATIEADPGGAPIRRAEVVAYSPTAAALQQALAAGFEVIRRQTLDGLNAEVVVLRSTAGLSTRNALARLRALDPGGTYDFNHIMMASGSVEPVAATAIRTEHTPAADEHFDLGLIDSGVDIAHPVLRPSRIAQAGCNGRASVTAHGTAVASLLVGKSAGFAGGNPGASLLALDVYCGVATGGAVDAVADAVAVLARQHVNIVNISLVGPQNLLLAQVIRAAQLHGILIVAAVGNDGPAAAPLYPAAYAGVIAVTAVGRKLRVLPEACRGTHVQFAAPGADLLAADMRGGLSQVRGTSFAAPIVAGLLSMFRALPGADNESALAQLREQARDLGKTGRDPIYGFGLVGEQFLHNRKD
jgi:hypothetical protein